MEKSIETIWKEGFLKNEVLVAPKLNNLYQKKSKHILDKIERMMKINLIAIVIGSTLFLIFSFIAGISLLGISFFLICSVIVFINRKLMRSLSEIDKNVNSYEYLKSFDAWLKDLLSVNRKMARLYYPLFFLTIVLGVWFSNFGRSAFNHFLLKPGGIYLIKGIPAFWILTVILIVFLLGFFGGRIYNWDARIVYGRVFKKLDDLIGEIEDLRR